MKEQKGIEKGPMRRGVRSKANHPGITPVVSGVTPYSLRLYVAGSSLRSTQAVQIVQRLCTQFPEGRCRLEVVDLFQQPELAKQDNIVAIPSLIKVHPPPRRAFVGITEDINRILVKLGIPIVGYGGPKSKNQ